MVTAGGCSGDTSEQTEIVIDGETWIAALFRDSRYRLFKPEWRKEARVRLPGEYGRCGYCLSENRLVDDDSGISICDECGETEIIGHGVRKTVAEVTAFSRQPETNSDGDST